MSGLERRQTYLPDGHLALHQVASHVLNLLQVAVEVGLGLPHAFFHLLHAAGDFGVEGLQARAFFFVRLFMLGLGGLGLGG